MLQRLYHSFELLEIERSKILTRVAEVPTDYLNHCLPGKWSILQILAHVVTSEQLSVSYIKKKSLGILMAGDSGILEEIKFAFLKASQRLPLRYKAPVHVQNNTPVCLSLDEVAIQWNDVRTDLKNFLESFEQENLRKKIYRHPVAGRLKILQALGFLYEHILHHKPQIDRLLNPAFKPK